MVLTNNLTPEHGLIVRITHIVNLPWILDNGIHCRTSNISDPKFVSIGNPELIERRRTGEVPITPGGHLADYVPFYFTPYSPMIYNIKTGYGGIRQRGNREIIILVSSLSKMQELQIPFVFTDRHASLQFAQFYDDIADLINIDFEILQRKDFKRDPDVPDKLERYQAEALIRVCAPTESLLGVECFSKTEKATIDNMLEARKMEQRTLAGSNWYFL